MIGAPFYVMERVEGDVIDRERARRRSTTGRRRIGEELVDALVEVHAVDWRACGLEGYGKPTGYLERQLRRFGGLWEHNRTRELPVLDQLDRVARRAPARVRPGDDRARRLPARQHDVRAGAPARLAAIFDWELATIGDPLADVGYLVATWAQPGDPEDARARPRRRSRAARASRPASELIARYEERSGPLDVGPALVHDARAVEVGDLPRGLLQAPPGGHDRGRVLRPARDRACRRSREAGAGRIRHGLILDYGGVLTTSVFASFARVLRRRGARARHRARALPRRPARRATCSRELETGELADADFERALRRVAGRRATRAWSSACSAACRPDEAMIDGVRAARAVRACAPGCCRTRGGDASTTTAR